MKKNILKHPTLYYFYDRVSMQATVQRPSPSLNILHWQLKYPVSCEQFMYRQDNTGGEHQSLILVIADIRPSPTTCMLLRH
jgi:hypothetical protein